MKSTFITVNSKHHCLILLKQQFCGPKPACNGPKNNTILIRCVTKKLRSTDKRWPNRNARLVPPPNAKLSNGTAEQILFNNSRVAGSTASCCNMKNQFSEVVKWCKENSARVCEDRQPVLSLAVCGAARNIS